MKPLPALSTTLLPSAARTTAQVVELPRFYSSIQILMNVTADPATASLTPTIEGWDEASGTWVTLLTGAAVAATGLTRLVVAEWAPTTANVSATIKAPPRCRVSIAVANADSMTYSLGAWLHE